MDSSLIEMVERHEGFRATVYCDACGHELYFYHGDEAVWLCHTGCKGGNLTVGCGTRVDGAGITPEEARLFLQGRIVRDDRELMGWPWYTALDNARRGAILDMSYTMGVAGVLQFKQMIAALEKRDFTAAALGVADSKWAKQAQKRAYEIADIIRSGRMQR